MPRRNDIQKILVMGFAAMVLQLPPNARSQVDCVLNHTLKVREISGVVLDPSGEAVSTSTVSAIDQKGHGVTAQTSSDGRFALQVPQGRYELRAELNGFEPGQANLMVRRNVWNVFPKRQLYVILGLPGSYCPWVTASKKDFEYNIRANSKRLKELK
jgi:hypothetical protein